MKHWKPNGKAVFAAIALSFCGTACIPLPGGMGRGSSAVIVQSSGSDSKKDDKEKIKRSRTELRAEYFAKNRGEACDDNRDCRDVCADLYSDDYGAQDECFKLRETAVEDMETVVSILEDPSIGELKNIEHKVFDILLEISVEPWVAAARRADRKEAGIILAWIAQSRNIAGVILDHGSTGDYVGYESYAGFKELLKAADGSGSTDCEKYLHGFTRDLNDSNYNFCGIAHRESNTKVTDTTEKEGILGDFTKECNAEITAAKRAGADLASDLIGDCKL